MKLQQSNKIEIRELLYLLAQFLKGQTSSLPEKYLSNPKIFHYYKEIVRYWNQLNFILRRTLQAMNQLTIFDHATDINSKAAYLFATFRIIRENALKEDICREINTNLIRLDLQFNQFLNKLQTFSWEPALRGKSALERVSIEEAVPSFVVNQLQQVMSLEFLKENLHFMNASKQQTEFTIRINDLDAESTIIESIQQDLNLKQIPIRQDPDISGLFHVPADKKFKILQNKWYKAGRIIIVDKASAAVVQILNPNPNDLICDICAAPGIKTSLIAQTINNKGQIIALDFHKERVYQMKSILRLFQVSNTHLINADGINPPLHPKLLFDRVLLDAPCTGSGTFLTNPELKWRQNEKFLRQNVSIQASLLKAAIKILKPGGTLIYSTCSLYPQEGEYQILKIIDEFTPLTMPIWVSPSYLIKNKPIQGAGRLFPSTHKTQGFFLGKFKKS